MSTDRENQNNIVTKAQRLRKNPTFAEKTLWKMLRRKQLGFKFRRQHPFKPYIVDFYCPKLRLIIEVDGDTHSSKEAEEYDYIRDSYLCSLVYFVVRIANEDVKNKLNEVCERIRRLCVALNEPLPSPPCFDRRHGVQGD